MATVIMMAGCTGNGAAPKTTAQPKDTNYTDRKALLVYDYEPERALRILDSAVIVGNVSDWQADKSRARIYCQTQAGRQLDSLMHWTPGARLDSARAIGERLLQHDSISSSLSGQQDVLEMLAYTARLQNDTALWLQRAHQVVDVCRRQGAETEALRWRAEVGAALCHLGQPDKGMAVLDSVITVLGERQPFKFNELDALIIAVKRKISALGTLNRQVETLPLARRVTELLDDYEQHPDRYHDGSYREPPAEKRDDYIRFYRAQAENFVASAYAVLGQTGSMKATFERLENIIRDAETREHQARYRALEQQLEAQHQRALAERNQLLTIIFAILFVAALVAFAWYWHLKRVISRKNRALVRQIGESMANKDRYEALLARSAGQAPQTAGTPSTHNGPDKPLADDGQDDNDAELFAQFHDAVIREQLYLNPLCDRQMIIDRFQFTRDQLGVLFGKDSEYKNVKAYINALRLEHASRLLTSESDMDIKQIAAASGFSSHGYFCTCFKQHFGLSPSDYRSAKSE